MYNGLVKAPSLVEAAPAFLAGEVGVSREEEQPKRPLLGRHHSRYILNRLIDDVEPLINTGFRCSLKPFAMWHYVDVELRDLVMHGRLSSILGSAKPIRGRRHRNAVEFRIDAQAPVFFYIFFYKSLGLSSSF